MKPISDYVDKNEKRSKRKLREKQNHTNGGNSTKSGVQQLKSD